MNRTFKTLIFILLILAHTNSAAAVTNLNISPENPVKGDTVTLSGSAQPDKEVKIETSFEKKVNVQNSKYEFSLDSVKIPDGKNKFTVIAHGCEDLKVSVKILIWLTLSSEAKNGTAKVSRSAPSGTYDIIIHGKSNQDSVYLEIIATGYVKSNENGEFSYSYDTSSIPPGEFKVNAGNVSQTVTLLSEEPTPSSNGGSSGGGGGGGIITTPVDTPTPTPTPTTNSTPTPANNSETTPTPTNNPSTSHTQTPEQNTDPHDNKTSMPNGIPTKSQNGTEVDTPPYCPDVITPGFSIILAILTLASIAILRRKGKI